MHAPARLVVAAAPARVGAGPGYGGPAVCLFSLAAHTMEGPRVGVIQSRIRSVCFFVWFDVRGDFPPPSFTKIRDLFATKRQSSLAVLNLAKHGSVRTQS
jgi:hypothetical protein